MMANKSPTLIIVDSDMTKSTPSLIETNPTTIEDNTLAINTYPLIAKEVP